ncbi:MAG: hypothetical protein JEZ03_14995, partial [Bacteroidales bacterium]|nr:hypothetical protein [Bacteroidales bacterium]
DSLTALSLKPVFGFQYSFNQNGSLIHSWGGLEFRGCFGKHLSIYSSLRDNNLSRPIVAPEYFSPDLGVPMKSFDDGAVDFSEARGGITYSWKSGSIGLIKDHLVWGTTYTQSNIFSGRTPSFAMIKFNLRPLKWFEFNYFHGSLVSNVVDSVQSYWDGNSYRNVFRPKFIAANMFTFIPFKRLHISFGNSIVYSDANVQMAYLNPLLFYKSVDHTLSSMYVYGQAGQNAQMFFDVSSRQIKHLHLYGTLFVDELSLGNMFDPEKQSNLLSIKGGFCLTDFPLPNVSLIVEYTRTNPLAYQHFIASTTFESNEYNLGHYLKDNSDDLFLSIRYKPLAGLKFSLSYNHSRHGEDIDYRTADNRGLIFIEEVLWENKTILFQSSYEFANNAYLNLKYQHSNIKGEFEKYTPEYYWALTDTFSLGMNIGF